MSFWERMARRSREGTSDEAQSINIAALGAAYDAAHKATATALMEQPIGAELPLPQPVKAEPSAHADVLDEYEALAESIGFAPKVVRTERLRTTLAEMGLCIYERAKVEGYLTSKFGAEKRVEGVGRSATWVWRPMRTADITRDDATHGIIVFDFPPLSTNGTIQYFGPSYDKAVPMPVLHTVKRVLERIPKARFFVSDETSLAERFRDPFLAVMLPDHVGLFVIERWDEPSFRG